MTSLLDCSGTKRARMIRNREGLPLGVQVVGPFGCDHVTIAVAQQLEEEFGGWVLPRDSNKDHSG